MNVQAPAFCYKKKGLFNRETLLPSVVAD